MLLWILIHSQSLIFLPALVLSSTHLLLWDCELTLCLFVVGRGSSVIGVNCHNYRPWFVVTQWSRGWYFNKTFGGCILYSGYNACWSKSVCIHTRAVTNRFVLHDYCCQMNSQWGGEKTQQLRLITKTHESCYFFILSSLGLTWPC